MGRVSSEEHQYLVPILTADSFQELYPNARPDIIKIDIEGAESAFLSGAGVMLESAKPSILLALHGATQSQQCCEALRSMGYSISTSTVPQPSKSL